MISVFAPLEGGATAVPAAMLNNMLWRYSVPPFCVLPWLMEQPTQVAALMLLAVTGLAAYGAPSAVPN